MSRSRLALYGFFLGVAALIALGAVRHHGHAGDQPAAPDVPPVGATVECTPAALAGVCRTYPPGDDRWRTEMPLSPVRPLPGKYR